MFLSYTPTVEISEEEQYILATDMALAALVGDNIYNFGEVVQTPVLHVLQGTQNAWLHELVNALHHGNISDFNRIVDSNRDSYFQQPSLGNKHDIVKQKVALLSLMNMVFERPSHDRTIAFVDIAGRALIPIDQV